MSSRSSETFEVDLDTPHRADVYLAGHVSNGTAGAWLFGLVRALDAAEVRCVGDVSESDGADQDSIRRIMSGCRAAIVFLPCFDIANAGLANSLRHELETASGLGLPTVVVFESDAEHAFETHDGASRLTVHVLDRRESFDFPAGALGTPMSLSAEPTERVAAQRAIVDEVVARLKEPATHRPAFAYLICRMEKDFGRARDSVRRAVKDVCGIACLWSDDMRHRTNVEGVRERTLLLIRDAEFVVADISLGPENPEFDNPSRAHEVGFAVAYGRPLFLLSQEPRRIPYHSVNDLQIYFWRDEDALYETLCSLLRDELPNLGRRDLTSEVRAWDAPGQGAGLEDANGLQAHHGLYHGPGYRGVLGESEWLHSASLAVGAAGVVVLVSTIARPELAVLVAAVLAGGAAAALPTRLARRARWAGLRDSRWRRTLPWLAPVPWLLYLLIRSGG